MVRSSIFVFIHSGKLDIVKGLCFFLFCCSKHGRVKVRTTEQEAERKKKEQAIKLKAYQISMAKILAKRAAGQYDDELMELTVAVLIRNPDIFTLWNIRREYLLQIKADDPEAAEEKLKKELPLTESCIQTNPKSYNAWHHRCWALENMAAPNWENEVKLCTKYLHLDERNCMNIPVTPMLQIEMCSLG